MARVPRFTGRQAASERASTAARGASRKRDTKCELLLRKELWRRGLRYRVDVASLPGRPDVVVPFLFLDLLILVRSSLLSVFRQNGSALNG